MKETTKKTAGKKATTNKVTTTAVAAKTAEKKAPAKKVATTKKVDAPVPEIVAEPAHEEISTRAYLIWANRGFTPGDPNNDWIQAERELKRA